MDALSNRRNSCPPQKGALGSSPAQKLTVEPGSSAHRTPLEAKAKALRPDRSSHHKAKRGDQHARRTVMKKIPNKGIVAILFEELVPAMDSGARRRLPPASSRVG